MLRLGGPFGLLVVWGLSIAELTSLFFLLGWKPEGS